MGDVVYLNTEAEQNRLIIGHMSIVEPIAAGFRGVKGIPFEELVAEGRAGLVSAARRFRKGDFEDYAAASIRYTLGHFVKKWQNLESLDIETAPERDFYEWKIYPDLALGEAWTSLAATPEGLMSAFEEISGRHEALQAALIFLSKREKQIIHARFFRDPPQELESIARQHKISYWATVKIIDRTLKRLKETIQSREAATPVAMQG
jgi:RNA polymerase sigma factor (sigma-70 family)